MPTGSSEDWNFPSVAPAAKSGLIDPEHLARGIDRKPPAVVHRYLHPVVVVRIPGMCATVTQADLVLQQPEPLEMKTVLSGGRYSLEGRLCH